MVWTPPLRTASVVPSWADKNLPSIQHKGGVIMKRTMMGVDLAKNVFEVYVEDEGG